MKWKKLGKIFDVDNIELDWMNSHAMMPIVEKYSDTQIRVYFSPRDIRNQAIASGQTAAFASCCGRAAK